MLKGLGNLMSMVKQAQEMQSKMGEVQEQLAELKVEGQAGGGMVTVEANGQQKILAIRIEDSLVKDNDREMIEELVLAATNQALDKAKEAAADQMKGLAGDMPGLDDALSQLGLGGAPGE